MNGSGKILNGFEGAQKEYVYFGKSGGSAVKWRVLSTNDNKYSNGKMLLWSDKQITQDVYNPYYMNPEYAFWGTSYIRASLNGSRAYYNEVDNESDIPKATTQISESSSWYGKLFTTDGEKNAIESAKSYTTDNFGFDATLDQFITQKSGITATADAVDGKYNKNRINAASHPTSQYAKVNGTSVQETTSGDKLFLLDYYDINNTSYGFGDNGQTYAAKVAASEGKTWSTSSNWYPCVYDGSGQRYNDITSDYLAFTPTGTEAGYYWLRTAGRGDPYSSGALYVESAGFINVPNVCDVSGIRPAFNLDTTKIAYVNRNNTTVSSTFTKVSGTTTAKPEYKLYVKSSDYATFSSNAVSALMVDGNNLKVTYNNPASVSSGNIMVLLTEKGSTDGTVAYQAAATLGATANESKTATATFSLTGVTLSNYDITVLLTSANGGKYAETVYCSYASEGNVTVPHDIDNLTYDGTCKWVAGLSTKPDWYDANLHNNEKIMTVSAITYKSNAEGATAVPLTATEDKKLTDLIVNAGEYEITMTLADSLKWAGSETTGGDKKFKIIIGKADPVVTAVAGKNNIYTTQGLPVNEDGTANVTNTAAGGTLGKFTWGTSNTIKVGTNPYSCLFTPTDINNYNTKDCSVNVTFLEDEISGLTAKLADGENGTGTNKLYTSYSLDKLKTAPWNLIVQFVYASGHKEEISDYTLKVIKDGSPQDNFYAGTNKVRVSSGGFKAEFDVTVIATEIESIDSVDFNQNGTKIYPNTSLDSLRGLFTVEACWNYNKSKAVELSENDFKVVGTLVPGTGTSTLYIVYTKGGQEVSEPVPVGALNKITVDYLTYNMNGVTLSGDLNPVYDGKPHALTLTGTLPEGVTAGEITYTKQGGTPSTTAPTEVGTYTVTVSFTGDTVNYKPIDPITKTLTIKDAVITDITVEFEQDGAVYTSSSLDVLKDWITVTAYYDNGTDEEITDGYNLSGELNVGASTITVTYGDFSKTITVNVTAIALDRIEAEFTQGDNIVYTSTSLDVLKAWLTVTAYNNDKSEEVVSNYALSGELTAGESEITVTYNGKTDTITVNVTAVQLTRIEVEFEQDGEVYPTSSLSVLKPWLKVTAYYNDESEKEVTDYELSGVFTIEDCEITVKYGELSKTISVDVTDVAIVSVEFTFTQDGVVYPSSDLEVLRQWLTVTATFNNEATDEIENYELSGEFTVGESTITVSYGDFSETITVEVTAAEVDYIEAEFTQGGVVYHTTELGALKDWLTVTAHYTDGTSGVVTDYELSGAFTAGASQITVTYAEHTDTVTVTVDKVKIALPVYKGTLSYSGDEIKPAAEDFEGFDSALMAFVESKTVAGVNAGAYKAVFALIDTDRYEWATATTLKKALFAVVYEEVVLEDYEAAVDWNLARAKISATKANGKLPVFASESFTASLADIVGLKYYTDEACTEEISADELAYSTKYYVKAELLNSENFELDESAMTFSKTAFEYTTPEKQLTIWEKIVKFVVTNWLWIAIAAAALLLLIIIIACAAHASKKKRIREERRLAEEKAERERREEREEQRRREDREERMARMSQQQMMMPQMMPQGMPQAGGQSMAMGGASSNEIAELKAEMAAMKASQDMAKELAIRAEMTAREMALRAEQNAVMRSDINALRGGEQTSGIIGISLDKLTELVEKTVERVLGKEKPAAEKAEGSAVPVAAQVPPDAVMTTVTTTKIDTTKKPAQTAQAPAPVRTVVRNLVAPMPVDDGRVFDVGGFYNLADPVTDDIDNLLGDEPENK